MSETLRGGCACGAVRYASAGAPVFVAHCHCTDCQKMTGAHMATVAGVPQDGFRLERGRPGIWVTVGDTGGEVRRAFCAECGSTLYSDADAMPGMMFLEAGSLDDAKGLQPAMHIYTASAQPWARFEDGLPSHPGMPPA